MVRFVRSFLTRRKSLLRNRFRPLSAVRRHFFASTNQSGPSIACSGHSSRASADAFDTAALIGVLFRSCKEGERGRVRTPRRNAFAKPPAEGEGEKTLDFKALRYLCQRATTVEKPVAVESRPANVSTSI